jgi:hypothetical protein
MSTSEDIADKMDHIITACQKSNSRKRPKQQPKQQITLEVNKVFLIEQRSGCDTLVLSCQDNEALKDAVGEETAKKVFDSELSFSVRVTKGKGVQLARALGLFITDRYTEKGQ